MSLSRGFAIGAGQAYAAEIDEYEETIERLSSAYDDLKKKYEQAYNIAIEEKENRRIGAVNTQTMTIGLICLFEEMVGREMKADEFERPSDLLAYLTRNIPFDKIAQAVPKADYLWYQGRPSNNTRYDSEYYKELLMKIEQKRKLF